MIKKLKTQIAILTENNLKGYILLSVIFAAGAVLAFAFHGKGAQEEEIKLYFTDFISNVTNSGTDAIKTFNLSMANYIQFAAVMFLSSVTIVGAPAVLIYTLVKGFSFGTVICCLFKAFGAKAFFIILCAILPHVIIVGPCCLAYAFHCAKSSYGMLAGNINLKKSLLTPLGFGLLFLCIVSIGALAQAYIEPLFIKLISSQFVYCNIDWSKNNVRFVGTI